MTSGERVRIRGTVQGVGFRPHVAKIARARGVPGYVMNDEQGVLVALGASEAVCSALLDELLSTLPPLAKVASVERERVTLVLSGEFEIRGSGHGRPATDIASDAAICAECREELTSPLERRYRYPFTNCTHCGPRFSIAREIPFDRANTSMSTFAMCDLCRAEYTDEADRRFHAQAIACHACGPKAWIERADGHAFSYERYSALDPVDAVAGLLRDGQIVALRGLGGFHLLCDATNEDVVARLRDRKRREGKPFALMARDLEVIRRFAHVSEREVHALTSPAAPIVLLDAALRPSASLASSVAPGTRALGFMLPYTPLHHLVFRRLDRPIVCTSGNQHGEPQCTGNDEAKERLAHIADWFAFHDRDVVQRVDDSVVRDMAGAMRILRRARGYCPESIPLPPGFEGAEPVLSVGAHLKSTVCMLHSTGAVLSQHLGDLDEPRAFEAWQTSVSLLERLYDVRPTAIATDLHPEYRSTQVGQNLARARALPSTSVQHHHAHIAACLFEHGVPRNAGPVLGVAFDGLGMGLGGELWGGEFLLATYAGFERVATLKPVALLGGDKASHQPWRNLYAHLMAEMGWAELVMNFRELPIVAALENKPRNVLDQMLRGGAGAPRASSCGRLFDAVAAACGLSFEAVSFEGEAAMQLEASITEADLDEALRGDRYPIALPFLKASKLPYFEPLGMWRAILGDLLEGARVGLVAARFHVAVSELVVRVARETREKRGDLPVVLTGGVFQNRVLSELTDRALRASGFSVMLPERVPTNDGGISLGQAAVCAAQRLGVT